VNSPHVRLAIFASGSGTNAEAIMKRFQKHDDVRVVLLLSNKHTAYALERARRFGVADRVFTREQFEGTEVLSWLSEFKVTHIILAGFLWLVPQSLIASYQNRIINIHPALLPRYGGKGMYGDKVHQAVKAAGEKQSGITIHLVNERFDEGRILFQATCDLTPGDTPDAIAAKVHELEYRLYPAVIEQWVLETKTNPT